MNEIGAIINVRSFQVRKNKNIKSIYKQKLWGFSSKYQKRWDALVRGTRVLIYGDNGIWMAGYITEKFINEAPVDLWDNPTGYPYQIKLELINNTIDNIVSIRRDEMIEKIPLAKQGFRGHSIVLFSSESLGVTYPIKTFNFYWNEFLKRNNLQEAEHFATTEERQREIENISEPPNNKLDLLIKRINTYTRSENYISEADTISTIIEPLLKYLGWKTEDISEVRREYQIPGVRGMGHVDIALLLDNQPVVLIEVKSLTKELQEQDVRQILNYAYEGQVEWCILTNGREIRLYNARLKFELTNPLMFRITYKDFIEKHELLDLLSKDSIKSGILERRSKEIFTELIVRNWLKENIEPLATKISEERRINVKDAIRILQKIFTENSHSRF